MEPWREGGKQKTGFHQREPRSDADSGASAKWKIREPREGKIARIGGGPAVRIKPLRLGKIFLIAMHQELRHQHISICRQFIFAEPERRQSPPPDHPYRRI